MYILATIEQRFNRPEYIFRPKNILSRISRRASFKNHEFEDVLLPWGAEIKVRPNEVIGHSLWLMGVYELATTETIWRLIDTGETVVDVGANIGYITSLMGKRTGSSGQVYCFEAHPDVFYELCENVKRWEKKLTWNHIFSENVALSNSIGVKALKIPTSFNRNRGTAFLSEEEAFEGDQEDFNLISVNTKTLDMIFAKADCLHVLKLDVEGHELEVLHGTELLLSSRAIRDIVFEDHSSYPSAVTDLLEGYGYTVFKIRKGFWNPLLAAPIKHYPQDATWEPPNYLATVEPGRAIERLSRRGWTSLQKP